jgi:hypothetical protein
MAVSPHQHIVKGRMQKTTVLIKDFLFLSVGPLSGLLVQSEYEDFLGKEENYRYLQESGEGTYMLTSYYSVTKMKRIATSLCLGHNACIQVHGHKRTIMHPKYRKRLGCTFGNTGVYGFILGTERATRGKKKILKTLHTSTHCDQVTY